MLDSQIVAFTVVAAALTISPGPDTMLVLRNVLRGGRRDGVATTFGIGSGCLVHATLSALGVSMILMYSATLFHLVKGLGAAYLVWLGVQSLARALRRRSHGPAVEDREERHGRPLRRSFLEGCLSNLLNPKVAIFYLSFLPQFIGPRDPVLGKFLLLASIHVAMGLTWLTMLSSIFARTQRVLVHASIRPWLDGACGAVLVALGVRLALAER